MEFLEQNQICEWAERHGLHCGPRHTVELPHLPSSGPCEYARGRRSGRERAAADDLIGQLGSWDECIVQITLWSVWRSSEDWPRFYNWRGSLGERRSLDTAPGHRFGRAENPATRGAVDAHHG